MKSTKRLVCIVLAAAMLVGAISVFAVWMVKHQPDGTDTDQETDGTVDHIVDDTVLESFAPLQVKTDTSFFEDKFKNSVDSEEGEFINKTYDAFPVSGNTTNLQSHGTATYANINGETVMADAFFRVKNEALNDPNTGLGLLLYQCLQYKIKNPDADVKICFSSYRISPTLAVCVLPESRYYGYLRALHGDGKDYDKNGFVRIVYMLVEAAKMGIDVTIVGQLNSYGVKQQDKNGTISYKSEPSFIEYFNNGLKQDCYTKYAPGKKVSDFMNFKPVEWSLADKGGTDMMHVKCLAVSHYLSTDGVEYENAVFLSSSNLDTVDYMGRNGNNGAQSGIILTGHKEIYNATYNYMQIMAEYYEQEKLYEMREVVNSRNTAQAALILAGREDEIPEDEQIIYLGSDTDKIFKVYFTPIGGDFDEWNTDLNPYCEHAQNLYESSIKYPNEPLVYVFNCASYTRTFGVSETMANMIHSAFLNTKNKENRLYIRALNYEYSDISKLKVGRDIGFLYLKKSSVGVHSKDMQFSYVKDDQRYYVSLLSSCNFHSGAPYYQTNSMLTVTETEETGNVFYTVFGRASAGGCIE